jgi:apolipoprotein N-acyltransferase
MKKLFLFLLSLLVVAFGQPAFSAWCSLIAAFFGYALFWGGVTLNEINPKNRFWLATAWFCGVQLIQLSWMTGHPFIYIYAVLAICAFLMGLQFGLLTLFVRPHYLSRYAIIFALAGFWTLLEWSRLFLFSGFSWNPAGLALTANLYALQFVSIGGIYSLSFWVILVNLLALRIWTFGISAAGPWAAAACIPFLYGAIQMSIHQKNFEIAKTTHLPYTAVLVQTAFPIEETQNLNGKSMIAYVLDEWRQILKITKKHLNTPVDLIATPEFTVPFSIYSCVFPHSVVSDAFKEIYGEEHLAKLPKLQEPLAMPMETPKGKIWVVNNAYWAQAMANVFNADVVMGLEDAEGPSQERTYYSSAFFFRPGMEGSSYDSPRYEKRVLVPMGEYIPSSLLTRIARWYGIQGSFTSGQEAKIFSSKKKIGPSICYEETFSHMMREIKKQGADVMLNLTSDAWFPTSRLMQQHFDHARPRTVENGIPLLRACNTGITGAIDSLGRVVAVLGENPKEAEWIADSLKIEVPTYSFNTLYSLVGDYLILVISLGAICFALFFKDS